MIKTKLLVILMVLSFIFTSCHRGSMVKTENPAGENTAVAVEEERTSSFQPVLPRKYLYVNGIEIASREYTKEFPSYNIWVSCPEIKGLLDKSVQDKINKELWGEAQKFIDKPLPITNRESSELNTPTQKIEKWWGFSVIANYNNVLAMNIHYSEILSDEEYEDKILTYLYDLRTGNKLGIKDLFVDGADGIEMINERVVQYILRNHLEEEILSRPFQGIDENQPFYISDSMLMIVFDERNSEFVDTRQYITIPFKDFNGAIAVYDKYFVGAGGVYEKEKLRKKLLPNPIEIKNSFIQEEKPQYRIMIQTMVLEGLSNEMVEKKLNALFGELDVADFKEKAMKRYQDSPKKQVSAERSRYLNIAANVGGLLCVVSYDVTFFDGRRTSEERKYYCFDIETGQELGLKDLFKKEVDYKKIIKESILTQIDDIKLLDSELQDLDSAIDNADFFFDEYNMHILLRSGGLNPDVQNVWQFYIPFEAFREEGLMIFQ
ncbi:hypothetical protein [Clostridium formicaceticum]|uniref:DUF3298 domain-containing protein n=1 Tax=Clostridium formicaceticum TaxID=1497 RepID=A0AAC9RNH1_9CLOT|nr:hypothetical protein [Clostridium formicaceticum]AOY77817.1 hypothetical protein BJL90_19305 [Clostridium formicaceticum]ARE88428.1 hypothetical protein CLFO_28310 [Clostridium formicaceticum]